MPAPKFAECSRRRYDFERVVPHKSPTRQRHWKSKQERERERERHIAREGESGTRGGCMLQGYGGCQRKRLLGWLRWVWARTGCSSSTA